MTGAALCAFAERLQRALNYLASRPDGRVLVPGEGLELEVRKRGGEYLVRVEEVPSLTPERGVSFLVFQEELGWVEEGLLSMVTGGQHG